MSSQKKPPVVATRTSAIHGNHFLRPVLLSLLAVVAAICYWNKLHFKNDDSATPDSLSLGTQSAARDACFQPAPLTPIKHRALWDSLNVVYETNSFKSKAVEWLGGAVRVPTETFDDLGSVGEDTRWDVFIPFHNYLLDAFPRVHATLQLTKVNTYGLLFTWLGSDPSLKPLLLAAHQDVVPVEPSTWGEWKHPPFSGHFDGENIWGRGAADDKGGLIGILSSVESLIVQGFQPTRTVVLACGFDEEVNGNMGAKELAKVLETTYGKDGVAMIVDEGGGFLKQYGTVLALLATAEKGYLDVSVEVTGHGGHASMPPEHTTIGILSALLVELEANPHKVHLTREDPMFVTQQCVAQHAKELPPGLRELVEDAASSDEALSVLENILFKDPTAKNLVSTTQSINVVQGGVKVNALPEKATALVNYRISAVSSVSATKSHITELLKPLALRFNLTYDAFEERIVSHGAATLTLTDLHHSALEPAPMTPTDKDAMPYQLISGAIKATYNVHRSLSGGDKIIVSPTMLPANTDTRYYWNLTKHIFRYNHVDMGSFDNQDFMHNIHTVNEYIEIDAFLEMIRFVTTLILNADEATGL